MFQGLTYSRKAYDPSVEQISSGVVVEQCLADEFLGAVGGAWDWGVELGDEGVCAVGGGGGGGGRAVDGAGGGKDHFRRGVDGSQGIEHLAHRVEVDSQAELQIGFSSAGHETVQEEDGAHVGREEAGA